MSSDKPWLLKIIKTFQGYWERLITSPVSGSADLKKWPPRKQWVLAETFDNHQTTKNRMLMEVEIFPNDRDHFKNYTIEGDDPNLRITHFPPSNRVH